MIVVDSNVLAARNLTGVLAELAGRVEAKDPVWIMPTLWRYEFQNILSKALWKGLIIQCDARAAWEKASSQIADNEYVPSVDQVLNLAERHRITAYDANFIALAMEMSVMCVTEDSEL